MKTKTKTFTEYQARKLNVLEMFKGFRTIFCGEKPEKTTAKYEKLR